MRWGGGLATTRAGSTSTTDLHQYQYYRYVSKSSTLRLVEYGSIKACEIEIDPRTNIMRTNSETLEGLNDRTEVEP